MLIQTFYLTSVDSKEKIKLKTIKKTLELIIKITKFTQFFESFGKITSNENNQPTEDSKEINTRT